MKLQHYILSLLILLLFTILFTGCAHDERAEKAIAEAKQLLDAQPDSALSILDAIKEGKARWPKSQRMQYELVYAQAQNKAFVDFDTDSIVKEVVEYFEQVGTEFEKMQAYYVLGCAYRDMGEVPLAIDAYNSATQFDNDKNPETEKRLLSSIYSQMANLYHKQLLLSEEIEVREKSIRLSEQLCDTLYMALDYCKMSAAYCLLNEYDKAEAVLEKGRKLYIQSGHEEDWLLFSPILLDIYLKQVDKLELAKQIIAKYESAFGLGTEGVALTDVQRYFHYFKGKFYEAKGMLDSAEVCYRTMAYQNMPYTQKDAMYRGLLHVYQQHHVADSIVKYAQLYCEANDSSIIHKDRELVGRMTAAYKYSRYQKEASTQSRIASERKQQLLLVLAASIILLLCLSFAIISLRRNRKKKQIEIVRLTCELEEAEKTYEEEIQHLSMLEQTHQKVNEVVRMELEASRSEADHRQVLYEESQKEVAEINRQYNELMDVHRQEIERLKHKIDDLSKQGGISVNVTKKSDFVSLPIIQKVLRLTQSPLGALSNNEWKQLIKVYSEYYPELVHDLQQNSQITKQGIHACLLFALDLRSSDIANILKTNIQRVSNLKSEINSVLFNDHSAKNLVNNLKERYDIYTGI